MKKAFFLLLSGAMLFTSCKKDNDNGNQTNIFKGPETEVYHGKAWTWVELNKQDIPQRVGISINKDALNTVTHDHGGGGGHHDNHIVLKFHPKADATPFRHVWLNWNPEGHPPANVYTLPHFDMHFYMVSSEERETYLDSAKLEADPPTGYIPANHLGVDPIPAMGKHFVDLAAPELNGQAFTQTFIFGSYDKKLIFWEPMITLDFLKNTSSFERAIPQPAKFQKAGYYPMRMRVVKDGDVTNIILEGFVLRQAS